MTNTIAPDYEAAELQSLAESLTDEEILDLFQAVDDEINEMPDHHHGRRGTYRLECRGPLCLKANRDHKRERYRTAQGEVRHHAVGYARRFDIILEDLQQIHDDARLALTDPEIAKLRDEVDQEIKDWPERKHGSVSTYNAGCRGPLCRKAQRDVCRERYRRKRALAGHKVHIYATQDERKADEYLERLRLKHEKTRSI